MRSLNRDDPRVSLAALVIITLLLLAWSAWFFLAKIPLYETSRQFEVQTDGSLAVTFSPQALTRIQPGQSAVLLLEATAENHSPRNLGAVVMDTPTTFSRTNQVKIYVYASETLQPGLVGEVRVEVENLSPASLVQRSVVALMDQ